MSYTIQPNILLTGRLWCPLASKQNRPIALREYIVDHQMDLVFVHFYLLLVRPPICQVTKRTCCSFAYHASMSTNDLSTLSPYIVVQTFSSLTPTTSNKIVKFQDGYACLHAFRKIQKLPMIKLRTGCVMGVVRVDRRFLLYHSDFDEKCVQLL